MANNLTKQSKIEDAFSFYTTTKSDIYKHLPTLYSYGQKVKHITEFGVRSGRSTVAWIYSKPQNLICYDIKQSKNIELLKIWAKNNNINFVFTLSDVLKITIDITDLLFLDTLHTYNQLSNELKLHHNKVNKYIIIHDTVTYGKIGMDKKSPALLQAIKDFKLQQPQWKQIAHFEYNNGLTILENIRN
jgi:hypothetical protein